MIVGNPDKDGEWFCWEFLNTMKAAIRSVNRKGATILEEKDLINTIFMNFMENNMKIIRDFKGKKNCSLIGYVYTISRRQAIKIVEKEKRKNTTGSYDIDLLPAKLIEDFELNKKDKMELLSKLIKKLPLDDRLFIEDIYKYEKSTEEIKNTHNLKNRDAVYKKKHRILKKLKRLLKKLRGKNGKDGEDR